jgi:hypothetical protein
MGIIRGRDKVQCDQCGKVIENPEEMKNTGTVEVRVHGFGIGFKPPEVVAFCSKECANKWWATKPKNDLIP